MCEVPHAYSYIQKDNLQTDYYLKSELRNSWKSSFHAGLRIFKNK